MSDKLDINNINIGPIIPQDNEIKVQGNKVPENLENAKLNNPPPVEKPELPDSPVELRKQIDKIVSTELSPFAASIANSAFESAGIFDSSISPANIGMMNVNIPTTIARHRIPRMIGYVIALFTLLFSLFELA